MHRFPKASPREGAPDLQYDYTTVGHVTIDVLDDGSRQPGGAAFYSALQAARLGRRTLILTRGLVPEIEHAIAPYRDELDVRILPARHTTTLQSTGIGADRAQRMLAWAGPIEQNLQLESSILHLAPVARESPTRWRGRSGFIGLTPQGLVRDWSGARRRIRASPPARSAMALARRCDALVLSEHEHASCVGLLARATAAGAVVAVTAGERPTTIVASNGHALELDVPALEQQQPTDDLGAGDVFAAAFFVALSERRCAIDAGRFANAAAAVRLRGPGADAIGDRSAIDARLHASKRAQR